MCLTLARIHGSYELADKDGLFATVRWWIYGEGHPPVRRVIGPGRGLSEEINLICWQWRSERDKEGERKKYSRFHHRFSPRQQRFASNSFCGVKYFLSFMFLMHKWVSKSQRRTGAHWLHFLLLQSAGWVRLASRKVREATTYCRFRLYSSRRTK